MSEPSASSAPKIIGRYALHRAIAAGGAASVHLGRLLGPVGFSRTVAIKRLQSGFAADPAFVKMFLDEARLAARIRHPNVVPVLDVVALENELFLVMEYVQGESLSHLVKQNQSRAIMPSIAVSVMAGALYGLHSAHEATNERGQPLEIVHLDVSPQNILVGVDGVVRVTDFGIAKAAHRFSGAETGQVQGKVPYMAPEQLRSERVDRRTDVYAASVVLWELLTGKRLFDREDMTATARAILEEDVPAPSSLNSQVPAVLDRLVLRGLSRDKNARFESAREMALELERAVVPAPAALVTQWVERVAKASLAERARWVAELESYPIPDQGHGELPAALGQPTLPPLGKTTLPAPRTAPPPQSTPPNLRASGTDFQVTMAPRLLKPRRAGTRIAIVLGAMLACGAIGVGAWQVQRNKASSTAAPAAPAPPPSAEREVMTRAPVAEPEARGPTPPAAPAPTESAAPAEPEASAKPETKTPAPARAAPEPAKPAPKPKAKGQDTGFGDLTRF